MFTRAPKHVRILIALATIAALLSVPTTAAAAPRGTKATFTITPLIAAVSTGQPGAFEIFVRNDGQGTFTHVTFDGTLSSGSIAGAPAGCTWSGRTVALLSCPSSLPATSPRCASSPTHRAQPGRSGSPGCSPSIPPTTTRPRHRGTRSAPTGRLACGAMRTSSVAGRWRIRDWSRSRRPASGGSNGQSTSVEVPAVGVDYPATLAETGDAIVCGGSPIAGFGKTVLLSIANGDEVDPYLTDQDDLHQDSRRGADARDGQRRPPAR